MRSASLGCVFGSPAFAIAAACSDSSTRTVPTKARVEAAADAGGAVCGVLTDDFRPPDDGANAVLAEGAGRTIANATISSSGTAPAVVATGGGTIDLTCSTVRTIGEGATGVVASGAASAIALEKVDVRCTAPGTTGVVATGGGRLTLVDTNVSTVLDHAPAVVADAGGTITITRGSFVTNGKESPLLDVAGAIAVFDANLAGTGANAAILAGAGSLALTDSTLAGSRVDGVRFVAGAPGGTATFTMTGGTLSTGEGPLLHVIGTAASIELTGVKLLAFSPGPFVALESGGTASITARHEAMTGDVLVDATSAFTLTLADTSTLTGAIDPARAGGAATITLDASSTWNITADSHVACVASAAIDGGAIPNVIGNGHTVHYRPSACRTLGGGTYLLGGSGGTLAPE